MHLYLTTIGFHKVTTRKQVRDILRDVVETCDERTVVEDYGDGIFVECTKYYAQDLGICVCGVIDEDNTFHVEYYYPFFRGTGISSKEPVVIQRTTDREAFSAACDDFRIGVTLIFYLQQPALYLKMKNQLEAEKLPLTLTGLSKEGKILLPLQKDTETVLAEKEQNKARGDLIAAAMDGDEDAIETLTMEDMDTYSMISERIATEDVFSIVDSYFMPYGNDCDQYNLMGEILHFDSVKNSVTGEEIFKMTLDCNDLQFDVCINKENLLGEPAIGRRFKGIIWLQGQLHYEAER